MVSVIETSQVTMEGHRHREQGRRGVGERWLLVGAYPPSTRIGGADPDQQGVRAGEDGPRRAADDPPPLVGCSHLPKQDPAFFDSRTGKLPGDAARAEASGETIEATSDFETKAIAKARWRRCRGQRFGDLGDPQLHELGNRRRSLRGKDGWRRGRGLTAEAQDRRSGRRPNRQE